MPQRRRWPAASSTTSSGRRETEQLQETSGQDLTSIDVTNGFGEASGMLVYDGTATIPGPLPVTVLTASRDGGPCVRGF